MKIMNRYEDRTLLGSVPIKLSWFMIPCLCVVSCVLCFGSLPSCVVSCVLTSVLSPVMHVCLPLSASIVSSVIPLRYLTCCSTSPVPHLVISVCVFSLCLPSCLCLSVRCFCWCDVLPKFLASPVSQWYVFFWILVSVFFFGSI